VLERIPSSYPVLTEPLRTKLLLLSNPRAKERHGSADRGPAKTGGCGNQIGIHSFT